MNRNDVAAKVRAQLEKNGGDSNGAYAAVTRAIGRTSTTLSALWKAEGIRLVAIMWHDANNYSGVGAVGQSQSSSPLPNPPWTDSIAGYFQAIGNSGHHLLFDDLTRGEWIEINGYEKQQKIAQDRRVRLSGRMVQLLRKKETTGKARLRSPEVRKVVALWLRLENGEPRRDEPHGVAA